MLKISGLRKEFDTVVAVDGVSLDVQRGELFGLLGPNGAGKTTTIRTVLNIIKPDSGSITFDDRAFSPEMWNIIGYLPEERGLYRKSRIIATILYFAALKGIEAEEATPRAHAWLERFGLSGRANDRVEELSKGNQQKVQLITSLIHNPQLLILDEPFSGLDPVNQILLKDVLMELKRKNVAIIFSTHQMEQVEKMCDNICLINKGKKVLGGPLRQIKQQYGKNSVHLEFEGDAGFLAQLPMVRRADVYQNYAEVELHDPAQSGSLLKQLDGKVSLRKFEVVEPSLHSIFINVVGTPEPAADSAAAEAVKTRTPMDPRVRKALLSLGVTVVIALILTVTRLQGDDPDWTIPGLMLLAVGISVFRLFKAIKETERTRGGKGAGS